MIMGLDIKGGQVSMVAMQVWAKVVYQVAVLFN